MIRTALISLAVIAAAQNASADTDGAAHVPAQIRSQGDPTLCVDTDGAVVLLAKCDATIPTQFWTHRGDGVLANYARPQRCMSVWRGEGPEGTIVLKACDAGVETWTVGAGRTLRLGASMFGTTCVDVPENRFEPGVALKAWSCHAQANQRFNYEGG